MSEWVTDWPRSGIELPGQLKTIVKRGRGVGERLMCKCTTKKNVFSVNVGLENPECDQDINTNQMLIFCRLDFLQTSFMWLHLVDVREERRNYHSIKIGTLTNKLVFIFDLRRLWNQGVSQILLKMLMRKIILKRRYFDKTYFYQILSIIFGKNTEI